MDCTTPGEWAHAFDEIDEVERNQIDMTALFSEEAPAEKEESPVAVEIFTTEVANEDVEGDTIDMSEVGKLDATIISSKCTLNGDITGSGDILVKGSVNGAITTDGNVLMDSGANIVGDIAGRKVLLRTGTTVQGDISCDHVEMKDAIVKGCVKSAGDAKISGCAIEGAVQALTIDFDGEIQGDLDSADHLIIRSKSSVDGSIMCSTLEVQSGATIKGNMKVNRQD